VEERTRTRREETARRVTSLFATRGMGGTREDSDDGTAPTQISCPQGEEKTTGYDNR